MKPFIFYRKSCTLLVFIFLHKLYLYYFQIESLPFRYPHQTALPNTSIAIKKHLDEVRTVCRGFKVHSGLCMNDCIEYTHHIGKLRFLMVGSKLWSTLFHKFSLNKQKLIEINIFWLELHLYILLKSLVFWIVICEVNFL